MLRRSCSVDAQNGLAYARWKQGDAAGAAELAREAARHAGDGGHVRLRVMALSMLARVETRGRRATAGANFAETVRAERYSRAILSAICSFMCSKASALPRASSTGWWVCAVRLRCLKVAKVSFTKPL